MSDTKRRRPDRSTGPATLISEGCTISGNIQGSGDYLVSGRVEGDGEVTGSLTITTSGHWTGSIHAANIVVAGTVEGDVTATGHVEISETARINGTVSGESIAVAVGAIVEGVMNTASQDEPSEFSEKRQT